MDVGTELREARQRAGMSREQVSQRTNIPVAEVEALEQMAFDRLVGGFYLDRIVRAYAHEVGLDDSSRLVEQARAAHHMAAASASEMAHPLDLAPTDDDAVAAFPAESALLPLESARPSLESTLPSLQSTLPSSESTLPSFESAQLSSAASTTAPAHGPRSGNTILPVALIAAFLGGAALGAFVMYRSETKDAADIVSSRPASTRDSREVERPGVGTTGPATTDSSARNSAATPARPDSDVPMTVAPSAATPAVPAARPAAAPGPAGRATPALPPRATATLPVPAGTPATPPPEPRAEAGLSPRPASDLSGGRTLNTAVESSRPRDY